VFKGLAFETLGPWCKEAIDFINVMGNRLIAESGDSKIKEILFREDFPCHSTWKRCKHSGALFQIPQYYRKFLYYKIRENNIFRSVQIEMY
jgi:hypothetical protein